MSATDQVFNESVLRLQGWMIFLDTKENEFQAQSDRIRRTSPQTAQTAGAEAEPVNVGGGLAGSSAETTDAVKTTEDPWL